MGENFGVLLREIREEFDKHSLMLTAAVSAGFSTVDQGLDVPTMASTLDYINIMTYDYHGWWKGHAFTGHNSPLYGSPQEDDEDSPGYRQNIEFTINYYLDAGAKRSQILLGRLLGTGATMRYVIMMCRVCGLSHSTSWIWTWQVLSSGR